jgi:hypothetical protein
MRLKIPVIPTSFVDKFNASDVLLTKKSFSVLPTDDVHFNLFCAQLIQVSFCSYLFLFLSLFKVFFIFVKAKIEMIEWGHLIFERNKCSCQNFY